MYMTKLLTKINKTLRAKNGESIMESIVALMILGILMTTIVSIIRFSMVMTSSALSSSDEAQRDFNNLIHETYSTSTTGALTFTPAPLSANNPNRNTDPDAPDPVIPVFTPVPGHNVVVSGEVAAAFKPFLPTVPPEGG